MSAAVAPPNNTYIEGTSKAVTVSPIDSKFDFLKQNETCEIVEAATMFVHKGKYYSNGPFTTVTLYNQPAGGRYGHPLEIPTVKMIDGTIKHQFINNSPSDVPLFYFVPKNAASGGRKTRNQKRKSTKRRKSKTRHAMKYR